MSAVFNQSCSSAKSPVCAVKLGSNGITMPFFKQNAYQKITECSWHKIIQASE